MKKKLFQKIYERPKKKCLAGPGRTVACDPAAAAGRVMSSWLNNSMQCREEATSGQVSSGRRSSELVSKFQWVVSVRVNIITTSTSVTGAFGCACRGARSLFAGQVARRFSGQCPSTTEEKVCLRLRRPLAGWTMMDERIPFLLDLIFLLASETFPLF